MKVNCNDTQVLDESRSWQNVVQWGPRQLCKVIVLQGAVVTE